MANASRIRFFSSGFRSVLKSAGVSSVCHAQARAAASRKESQTGIPYTVEDASNSGRAAYMAKPADGARVPNLTHEQWMSEVWPRVGGPKWRRHR